MGDPILDGDVLSDRLAAIQRERRDIALRIDRGVIRAALRALRRQVDLFMLERQAGFMERLRHRGESKFFKVLKVTGAELFQ